MEIELVEIKIMPPSGTSQPEGAAACWLKMKYGRVEPE